MLADEQFQLAQKALKAKGKTTTFKSLSHNIPSLNLATELLTNTRVRGFHRRFNHIVLVIYGDPNSDLSPIEL